MAICTYCSQEMLGGSSCSVEVIQGRSGGSNMRIKGLDGRIYDVFAVGRALTDAEVAQLSA